MVTCEHMNTLLRLVLRLILNNVGFENAPWMTRIAGYTQQIIINSSEDLLKDPYFPLAERIRKRTDHMLQKEDNLRGFLKSSTEDTSQVEAQLQEEWHVLVRDIYAFYPLLIKYVDQQRNHWLKHDVIEAEDVYNHVARIFYIWSESQVRYLESDFVFPSLSNLLFWGLGRTPLFRRTGCPRDNRSALREAHLASVAKGETINH